MRDYHLKYYNDYLSSLVDLYQKQYEENNKPLSDEEILERMDINVIETFLRKKKLENIKKSVK